MAGNRIIIGLFVFNVSTIHARAADVELGRCVRFDGSNNCVEQEVIPADRSQNVVNNCLQMGGNIDPFGSCTIDPKLLETAVGKAKTEFGDGVYQGLLAFVKQCEAVSRNTAKVCSESSSMLSRARGQMNRFNDVITGQIAMSPADACTGMQDAVSASQVQLKAWQQTCGEALTTCQHACESTLVSVKSKDDLVQMTKKAIQACRAYTGQRDDVSRSVAMANTAIASSSLCRQQIGGDQQQQRKNNFDRTSALMPPTPSMTDLKIGSAFSQPSHVQPMEDQSVAPSQIEPNYTHTAVRNAVVIGTDERDVQGAARRPATVSVAEAGRMDLQNRRNGERGTVTGSPVRFPTGVARGTLDGTNRVGNNSQGWPIPTSNVAQAQDAAIGSTAPIVRAAVVPAAVTKGLEVIRGAKDVPSYGPKTREPSSVETVSYRHIGISGRGGNMFFNVKGTYRRIYESLLVE